LFYAQWSNPLKIQWKALLSVTAVAVALAALIGATSDIHFLFALAVFMFWGPINGLLCEFIASRNPLIRQAERERVEAGLSEDQGKYKWGWLLPTVVILAVSSLVAAIWTFVGDQTFRNAFARTSMIAAGALALNALVIEIEDNSPGGWLRSDTWKDEDDDQH
jgi:hypothetical protein